MLTRTIRIWNFFCNFFIYTALFAFVLSFDPFSDFCKLDESLRTKNSFLKNESITFRERVF